MQKTTMVLSETASEKANSTMYLSEVPGERANSTMKTSFHPLKIKKLKSEQALENKKGICHF